MICMSLGLVCAILGKYYTVIVDELMNQGGQAPFQLLITPVSLDAVLVSVHSLGRPNL